MPAGPAKAPNTHSSMSTFKLVVNFGNIVAPDDYEHRGQVSRFLHASSVSDFGYTDPLLTDINFPNPSVVIRPRDEFHLSAYGQDSPGKIPATDWLDFLEGEGGVHLGLQGLSLAYLQRRLAFPSRRHIVSIDRPGGLFDNGSVHLVPCVSTFPTNNKFDLTAGTFENGWNGTDLFLLFRPQVQPVTG